MTKEEMKGRVFMVCGDDETAKDVGDCLKRVSAAMSAVDAFSDKCTEVDEDADDFEEVFAPILNRLILTLMALYPNPKQMAMDIKSLGDFTVRNIKL